MGQSWVNRREKLNDWMEGWIVGWMQGWKERWKERWLNSCRSISIDGRPSVVKLGAIYPKKSNCIEAKDSFKNLDES